MKLVLLCTSVLLLISAVELAWRKSSRGPRGPSIARIYSDANISLVPDSILQVYFGDVNVTIGEELTPTQTQCTPEIEFDGDEGCYYTCVCISPDWPFPYDPFLSNSLLTLQTNLHACPDGAVLLEDSCAIASWRGPTPTPGTGPHRYLFYVFKQNGIINSADEALQCMETYRVLFNLTIFVKEYNLVSPPLAGTYFYSKYPAECNATS